MGRRANTLGPTLVINCGDARIKRQVEKAFKTQTWLQEILKSNGIMFVSLVVKITLSAGSMSGDATTLDLDKAYAVAILSGVSTSCGLRLLARPKNGLSQSSCTLGGLVYVDGAIIGLTAGHPFQIIDYHAALGPAQDAERSENEALSEASSESFVFNEDDDENSDTPSNSSMTSAIELDDTLNRVVDRWRYSTNSSTPIPKTTEWSQLSSIVFSCLDQSSHPSPDSACKDQDWALLGDLPQAVKSRPNKVAFSDPHLDTSISVIASSDTSGSVTICVMDTSPQIGYLHSSPASVKSDTFILDVQLITLERFLRRSSLKISRSRLTTQLMRL